MYIIALFYLYSAKLQKNCDLTKSLLEKVGILFVFYVHNAYYHKKSVPSSFDTPSKSGSVEWGMGSSAKGLLLQDAGIKVFDMELQVVTPYDIALFETHLSEIRRL